MRCREARRKLIKFRGIIPEDAENSELIEHIRHCPKCAALFKAENHLSRGFEIAAYDDNLDLISLQELKHRVESRIGSGSRSSTQETNIVNKIADQIRRRPKFGISLAAVVAILLVTTLVPIKWEETIGYRVAIAGVNKDLAMDQYKVQMLLNKLGMESAEYNVDDCEQTCQLIITKLKSEDDVNIVLAAFDKLGHCELKEVAPICEGETGSLMEKATNFIFKKPVAKMKMERVYKYVDSNLAILNELTEGDFDIWITKTEGEEGQRNVIFFKDEGSSAGSEAVAFDSCHLEIRHEKTNLTKFDKYFIQHITDENGEFVILENEERSWKFNLNDPEDLYKMQELGIDIEAARLANGEFPSAIYVPKPGADISRPVFIAETDDFADKHASPMVPEQFVLNQNYPNPFNPFTTVVYSLPQAEHVTLEIFNVNGQKIRTMVNETQSAGSHSVVWNGTDDHGMKVASGIYMYRLTAGEFTDTKKMTLIK